MHVLGRYLVLVVAEQDLRPEPGDAFRDERSRRPDHLSRLFELARVAHEELFLPRVLRVMAGIRLVGGQLDHEGGRHGYIGVHGDPAAQASLVVVERSPGLVGDVFDLDCLSFRKTEQRLRSRTEIVEECLVHPGQLLPAKAVALTPGLVALRDRSRAWEGLVKVAVSSLEGILVRPLRPNAVTALDLVLEGDLLAREPACNGLEPDELGAQPAATGLAESVLVERFEQGGGVTHQGRGLAQLLGLDLLRDLRRPVVGVDEPVDVPAEAQAELEIRRDDVHA